MITLDIDKAREYKPGEVIHFKVLSIYMQNPGRWRLTVEDVTPLPGAEPTGYGCAICGLIKEASPTGALPDNWVEIKFERGTHFLCPECKDEKVCRVCGCTDFDPCETGEGPCHWIEDDLCSACGEG